ncbi:Hydrogenase assembly protein HoxX [hydrothermal vent metagenome]|uniref:Hydrogenase assembly protein HoxX n=1 Tax=hydrothermal vent metagenome TaxID=652676 RepID=A0A3B1C9F5_9ZZZZ
MRILFLTHAFNSLTQRLFVELQEHGHEVSVEYDINDALALEAVQLYQPDLILAPFLKRAIAETIWARYVCLIVHPGIVGDRGPSALDWAILNQEKRWGVTVLQANAEMDAGAVWAYVEFDMREASKASLYRNEITEAAIEAVLLAVARFQSGNFIPVALDYSDPKIRGKLQPLMRQSDRIIDWNRDNTETVLRKIRSADGFPGVRDNIFGRQLFLYDARPEKVLRGNAGDVIARCGAAICRASTDGAVWLGHLRDKQHAHPFKLPATNLLAEEVRSLPEITPDQDSGYQDIWYEEEGHVGYLHFPFYNGAMGTQQCQRLRQAYSEACQQSTRIIVLMGGPDYWSNGMHLNLIEAADSAADESWRNINAIDDLALAIINTDSHLTIAALQGNAGAGGVFLARAADEVWARKGVILNPHYKDMGNLYGSEYWTYLLPRYAGTENAKRIIQARLPMGTPEAQSLGLVNEIFDDDVQSFVGTVKRRAANMATVPAFSDRLQYKRKRRLADEMQKPLQDYREQELEHMQLNFYGFDPSYHVARYNFVYQVPRSRTPMTLAAHRRTAEHLRRVI